MVSWPGSSATTTLPFCRARARRWPSTSSWRNGSEQARLDPQVFAQLEIQAGKTLLHRLVENSAFHSTESSPYQAARHQQQRFVPDIGDLTAALVHADHGVDQEDQGRRGDRRIALAEGAEEDHAERRQRHPGNEQPGIGEQQLDGEGGDAGTAGSPAALAGGRASCRRSPPGRWR